MSGERITARALAARALAARALAARALAARALAACALAGILALPGVGLAFVRQKATNGTAISWRSGCVFLTPDAKGTKNLAPDVTMGEINQAAMNWMAPTRACSFLQLMVDAPVNGRTPQVDGVNLIVWHEELWGHMDKNGTFMPYSPDAPAQTTIIFVNDPTRAENGEILDADVELNGVNYVFGVVDPANPMPPHVMDVQNTLTHELGHLLGLDHTCYNGETAVQPMDENGNPVPLCRSRSLPPEVTDATMYNFTDYGETKKRSIEADDRAGICSTYPTAADPHACGRTNAAELAGSGSSGCAMGPPVRRSPGVALLALIALAGAPGLRARGRRSTRCSS